MLLAIRCIMIFKVTLLINIYSLSSNCNNYVSNVKYIKINLSFDILLLYLNIK